ncbi:MAG TPA: hypothetical protein ENH41_04875 [Candidatus Omnitrophica bacterium]|nr:hypothetical protein [Candidatus Omnitrophota bacterium]
MPKIKYEIDPHNRLVAKISGKASRISKYRKVLDGNFRIDKKSRLIYHVKKSSDFEVPQQIKLTGNWSLDKNHNLALTLDKWNKQYAQGRLLFKGKIAKVGGTNLVFSLITKNKQNKARTSILKFSGKWRANKNNRLSFYINKDKNKYDILTFANDWRINKDNRIVYSYTRRNLKRKTVSTQRIVFKGSWDISNRYALSYVLDGVSSSRFDFKVSLGIAAQRGKKKGIKYKIGIGVSQKDISLFGEWIYKKDIGLLFAIEHEKGKRSTVAFSARVKLGKKNNLVFSLKNKEGRFLGIDITLSRDVLSGRKNSFIKFILNTEEGVVQIGAGFAW